MAKPSTTATAKAETTAADKGAPAPPPPAYESLKNKNDDDVSNTNASSDSPLNHPNAPPASTEENDERTSSSRFEKLTARELLAISPNSDQLLSSSSENGEKDEEETLKCEVGDPKKIGQGECRKRLSFVLIRRLFSLNLTDDDTFDTHHPFSLCV